MKIVLLLITGLIYRGCSCTDPYSNPSSSLTISNNNDDKDSSLVIADSIFGNSGTYFDTVYTESENNISPDKMKLGETDWHPNNIASSKNL